MNPDPEETLGVPAGDVYVIGPPRRRVAIIGESQEQPVYHEVPQHLPYDPDPEDPDEQIQRRPEWSMICGQTSFTRPHLLSAALAEKNGARRCLRCDAAVSLDNSPDEERALIRRVADHIVLGTIVVFDCGDDEPLAVSHLVGASDELLEIARFASNIEDPVLDDLRQQFAGQFEFGSVGGG